MVREEARRMLLREYDRWATDHPDNATKRSGVVFFTYLQKERSDLLDFHAVGGDKWATTAALLHRSGERLGARIFVPILDRPPRIADGCDRPTCPYVP